MQRVRGWCRHCCQYQPDRLPGLQWSHVLQTMPSCNRGVAFGPDLHAPSVKRWKHIPCGRTAGPSRCPEAHLGEFTVGDPGLNSLYERMGLDLNSVFANPVRRRMGGEIRQASGIQGVVSGRCTILFDDHFAILGLRDFSNPIAVPYSDISTLQFGGRGAFQVRTGRRYYGGGFGPVGILEGMALASVMSKVSSKTVNKVETIIELGWTQGHLSLLNQRFTPERIGRPAGTCHREGQSDELRQRRDARQWDSTASGTAVARSRPDSPT